MARRRWLYTLGGAPLEKPIEISDDWREPPQAVNAPVTDLYMDGVRASDGADIGSRKKRREYMKLRNLADADDFKGEWGKAAEQRERVFRGLPDSQVSERREAIARAIERKR